MLRDSEGDYRGASAMVGEDHEPITKKSRIRSPGDVKRGVTPGGQSFVKRYTTNSRGSKMQNGRAAKATGAITATSVRMGDRARAAAVKSAPRKWATSRIMSPAELRAWKESA